MENRGKRSTKSDAWRRRRPLVSGSKRSCHRTEGVDRHDLKSGDYVFFYRDGNSHNSFQHPSFHGRVELRDSEMKDGDVSVILKNVSINDTGTYECWIIITNSGRTQPAEPQLTNITNLTVTESGHTAGNITAGNTTDGENTRGHYVLIVPFGLIAFVLGCS